MEAMMYLDKKEISENAQMKALLEIFEQISVFNEIGYQTSHLAACGALSKIKNPSNGAVVDDAISQLHSLMERCRTASDKIDRLARSGSMIACKSMRNENTMVL